MELTDKTISDMQSTDLISHETVYSIFDLPDNPDRIRLMALMELRAKELNMEKQFMKVIKSYSEADKKIADQYNKNYALTHTTIPLAFDSKGNPANTINNFYLIMKNNNFYNGLQFNELSHSPEIIENGIVRKWTDNDDTKSEHYIEENYKLSHPEKHEKALRLIFLERTYHPIRNIIDAVKWDGKERIHTFLSNWTKCENTIYTREASRLIFAGGINRLYYPGCKFDDVVVLIGTHQGEGKSSLVRWLALKDEFYTDVIEIEGQKGIEALEGAWICELGELLALTKTKEQEAIKAFISRQVDHYRRPFDRRTTDLKRQCMFIGTTNKEQFLTDKTGGRRFYPIKVNQSGYDLFACETEIRAEILQCWAEAKYKMEHGKMLAYADLNILGEIKKAQSAAQEDDYREGMIESFLEVREECCIYEIWREALNNDHSKPSKKDSNDISLIFQSLGWIVCERKRINTYGQQRVWKRAKPKEIKGASTLDIFEDELPIL